MTSRRHRLANKLSTFMRQYGRRGRTNSDSNDRHYDRELEQQLRKMDPAELDALLRDDPDTESPSHDSPG